MKEEATNLKERKNRHVSKFGQRKRKGEMV